MWCPVRRRRDAHAGFRMERENLDGEGKGKGASGDPVRTKVPRRRPGADGFVVARKRGKARGAKGAGHRVESGSTGNRRNPIVSTEGGSLPRWHEPDDARASRPVVRPAKAGEFRRRKTSQGKSQSPVARRAGGRATNLLKPLDRLIRGRGASLQAVAHASAQVAPHGSSPGGRACNRAGEGRRGRRRLAEAADHSGGVGATAGRQGPAKPLEKPAASRRDSGGSQGGGRTGPPGQQPKTRGGRRGP